MDDPSVAVPLSDLQVLRAALNSAYNHNTVLDLQEGYRKLSNRQASSPMTKALLASLELVDGYVSDGLSQIAEEEENGREVG